MKTKRWELTIHRNSCYFIFCIFNTGPDSKFHSFSEWVNNVMREVDIQKEIKFSSFLLSNEFQGFVFASSGKGAGEVDETCKCFNLKFPNFFHHESSDQHSAPWLGLPSEIVVNPQALRY